MISTGVNTTLETFTEDSASSLDTVTLLIEQTHDNLSIAVGFSKDEWENLRECVSGTAASCGKENLENIVDKLIEYESIDLENIFVIDKKLIEYAKNNLTELNVNTNKDTTFSTLKTQMENIKEKFKDVPESV